ncbi:hypothetical protein TNCV_3790971 [Trichonephila clavipes]|nr:hypothetical protein TNCV_3790971 [Trichonephila clavipes]
MTHTSNERAPETVLLAGMFARNFVKTEFAITVQRAFHIKFVVNLQMIITFLVGIISLKQLAAFKGTTKAVTGNQL